MTENMCVDCIHLWEDSVVLLAFIAEYKEVGLIADYKLLDCSMIIVYRPIAFASLFLYMNIAFVIVFHSPTPYVNLWFKMAIALYVCDCRRRIPCGFMVVNRMTDWHRPNTSLWICWEDADSIQSSPWVSSVFKSEYWSRYRASYSKLPQKAILLAG